MKKIGKHEYEPDNVEVYEGEVPGWQWCSECGKYLKKPMLFEKTSQ